MLCPGVAPGVSPPLPWPGVSSQRVEAGVACDREIIHINNAIPNANKSDYKYHTEPTSSLSHEEPVLKVPAETIFFFTGAAASSSPV